MNSLRRHLSFLLIVCLAFAAPGVYAEGNILQNQALNGGTIVQNIVFVDVHDHWASDAIYDMAGKGIISGYDDETFQPEKSITREEFAKLIALTFSLDLNKPDTPTYSDVNPDKWSYAYVESAKEFLTGYYPPKGQAFFSPETKATREDVAVALVKVLGYSTNDVQDANTLSYRFSDVGNISYGLRDYVAIATEKQLISGYEDGTFRPDKPITRAEVATLLYRVIKSSAQDQADGPMLQVSMPEATENGTFYISGQTHRDAKVSVNGTVIPVEDGAFKEGFSVEKEGEYEVSVVAKLPSGKTTTVRKTITYKTSGPELKVDDIPEQSTREKLTLSGTVKDVNDQSPVVYLNDEKLYTNSWDGSFSKEVILVEGENTFKFTAKNEAGKETVITKKIIFNAGGSELKINSIPATTPLNKVTLSGTVKDKNDSAPVVYLNDEKLYVNSWDGSFSKEVSLEEGENTFTFKAENKNGKITTVVKTITFEVGGPVLKVDTTSSTTTSKTVTISGKVTDKNDRTPTVYINDEKMYVNSWDGSFSKEYTLEEGDNLFNIRATNANGKTSTVTRTITFDVGAPVLKLNYLPEKTTVSTLNVSGTVTDKNDRNPVLYFNDEKLYVNSWDGSFSKDLRLVKGENSIKIVATNSFGKSATVTRSVYKD